MKDPMSGNLDRIQIIKGWRDAKGETQEKVYDVAWSDGRTPGADGKLPPVGNTVDVARATWNPECVGTTRISGEFKAERPWTCRSVLPSGEFKRLQNNGASTITEEDARCAIAPINRARERLGADDECALAEPRGDEAVCNGVGVGETGAGG